MCDRLKILQVFNKYSSYGGEELVVENIDKMLSPYHQMDECLFSSDEWLKQGAPSKLRQVSLMFNNPRSRAALKAKVAQCQPDALLLHNIYPVGSPGIYAEALALDVPVVQYIHNFRPFSVGGTLWLGDRVAEESLQGKYWAEIKAGAWQGSRLKSALFAQVLRHLHRNGWLQAVKCWIAISEFMRAKFVEAGIPAEDIVTLLHPWHMIETEPDNEDSGYYLFLGRLVEEKGVKVLLEAWEIVEKEMGSQCPVLMIGGEGEMENEVNHAADNSPKIKCMGFVKGQAKADLIASSRAMIAPSVWWEPLGLVTYEAYDHGKPMLAASSGGLSETVTDGHTGYTHTPGYAMELAESVIRMEALKPEQRRAMGREGREWLKINADPDQWRDQIAGLIRSVKAR
ncbi:glycosyl transferase [Oceaniferula spumae]|uniref:Glycosyl transferase n=1 Tax=Oceaniferula spumae TaxID=2979115 RepID=A0AAT9FL54_9BACT